MEFTIPDEQIQEFAQKQISKEVYKVVREAMGRYDIYHGVISEFDRNIKALVKQSLDGEVAGGLFEKLDIPKIEKEIVDRVSNNLINKIKKSVL